MVDSSTWCGTAVESILSLWRPEESFARRSSIDKSLSYRPTATFHAIVAMGECGIWEPGVKFENGSLTTQFFDIPSAKKPPSPRSVLRALVSTDKVSDGVPTPSPEWAKERIDASSHTTIGKPTFQSSLVIGGLFQALRLLLEAGALAPETKIADTSSSEEPSTQESQEDIAPNVCQGFADASDRLLKLTEPKVKPTGPQAEILAEDPKLAEPRVMSEADLSEHEDVSTNLLLHVAIAISEREKILKGAGGWGLKLPESSETEKRLSDFQGSLKGYFRRQVDRLMARRHLLFDPEYDPTSLAFAMRGLKLLGEKVHATPLFRASVEAVVAAQHPDGCWSDGVSVTYDQDGSTIQQPSVEVALCLAESVFDDDLLVFHDADKIEALDQALEALEKTASYLTASYRTDGTFSGWVSDRTRRPGISETWITSYAARLFRIMFLAERARRRAEILQKYGARTSKRQDDGDATKGKKDSGDVSRRLGEVTEPDAVLVPVNILLTEVVAPLEKQKRRGSPIRRPTKNGVSFIIYGPPGSGKTFVIEQLAKVLGWPLLSLSPGHFIRQGLEDIESTAAGIFGDLMNLDHTVVFFDECDELFRERSEQSGQGRNILSFATASMLPKLQELHDARRVVFFLGTNFLSNVDTAIRRPGRFDGRLLFDRPDDAARRDLLKEGWDKQPAEEKPEMPDRFSKWGVECSKGWMSKDVKDLGEALRAQYEAGRKIQPEADPTRLSPNGEDVAVKKVLNRAKVTVPDYVDWCAQAGKVELEAAGVKPDDQSDDFWKVFDRWKQLPAFYEAYTRHSKKKGWNAEDEEDAADAFIAELKNRS